MCDCSWSVSAGPAKPHVLRPSQMWMLRKTPYSEGASGSWRPWDCAQGAECGVHVARVPAVGLGRVGMAPTWGDMVGSFLFILALTYIAKFLCILHLHGSPLWRFC